MLLKPINSLSAVLIEHDGYRYTLREWAEFLSIPYDTLRMRYSRGLTGDELFKQVRPRHVSKLGEKLSKKVV